MRVWKLAKDPAPGAAGPVPSLEIPGPPGGIFSVAWITDGKRLAAAGKDGKARVWDLSTHAAAQPGGLSRAPDRNLVAGISPVGSHHRLWRSRSDRTDLGNRNGRRRSPASTRPPAVSTPSPLAPMASCSRRPASMARSAIWDTATWKPVKVLRGHTEPVFDLAFNNDCDHAHVCRSKCDDQVVESLRRPPACACSNPSPRPTMAPRSPPPENPPRESPFAGSAASHFVPMAASLPPPAPNETVTLWNFATGRLDRTIRSPLGAPFALTYDHDGTRLAFASSRSLGADLRSQGKP